MQFHIIKLSIAYILRSIFNKKGTAFIEQDAVP